MENQSRGGGIMSVKSIILLVAAAVLASVGALVAQSEESISGFSPYVFGTTLGTLQEQYDLHYDTLHQDHGPTYTAPNTTVGGDEYEVRLGFQDDILHHISLTRWIEGSSSQFQCETEFNNILGAVQARYGPPDADPLVRGIAGVRSLEVRFTRSDLSQIRILAASTGICLISVDYSAGSQESTF